MFAEFEFVLSFEEVQSSLTLINGVRTLSGRKINGLTPYQELLLPKMSELINDRDPVFHFYRGIVLPNETEPNYKIHPMCKHINETRKSELTFSFEDYDRTNVMKFQWKIQCQGCLGVHPDYFHMLTSAHQLNRKLEESKGSANHRIYGRTASVLKRTFANTKNLVAQQRQETERSKRNNPTRTASTNGGIDRPYRKARVMARQLAERYRALGL